jgi:hypothetical protein
MRPILFSIALVLCSACSEGRSRPAAVDQPSQPTTAQAPTPPAGPGDPYVSWNLPRWVTQVLHDSGHYERYELFSGLNPYYQRGRFDDDDEIDIAVQVRAKATGKRGIAIVHRATGAVHVLGAGQSFGNGGDDFSWLWVWRVEAREAIKDPLLRGRELLLVEKPESAGGMIWWNGAAYVWTQWGD